MEKNVVITRLWVPQSGGFTALSLFYAVYLSVSLSIYLRTLRPTESGQFKGIPEVLSCLLLEVERLYERWNVSPPFRTIFKDFFPL